MYIFIIAIVEQYAKLSDMWIAQCILSLNELEYCKHKSDHVRPAEGIELFSSWVTPCPAALSY